MLHLYQWRIQARGPDPPPFWTKLRPEGPKKVYGGGDCLPPLSKGLDDLSSPLIQHCLHLYYMYCQLITPCFPGFQSNVAFSFVITIQEDK